MISALLQQAQAKIEELVTDQDKYSRLVNAGKKVIYDQETFKQLTKGLENSQTPVEDIAKGLVAVMHIMASKARGTIPHDVLLQAGMALLFDALDFAEQLGLIEVTKDVLDQATREFIEAMLPTIGLTPGKLAGTLGDLEGVMNDPDKMAAYQQSQGAAA